MWFMVSLQLLLLMSIEVSGMVIQGTLGKPPQQQSVVRTTAASYHPTSVPFTYAHHDFAPSQRAASWKCADYQHAASKLYGRSCSMTEAGSVPPYLSRIRCDGSKELFLHDNDYEQMMWRCDLYGYPEFWSFMQQYHGYGRCLQMLYNFIEQGSCALPPTLAGIVEREYGDFQKAGIPAASYEKNLNCPGAQARCALRQEYATHLKETQAQLIEADQEILPYMSGNAPFLQARRDRHERRVRSLAPAGGMCATKSYEISENVVAALKSAQQDVESYRYCYGNSFQQQLHRECIDIVAATDSLTPKAPMACYKDALFQCADAARAYNQAGSTHKALDCADLCWAILDCGAAVVEGACNGLVGAVVDMAHHPVETAACVFAGEYVLGYQLCKVFYKVAEIGALAVVNPSQASATMREYVQPLRDICHALVAKELTVRDAIKGVTTGAAQLYAQQKMLGGLHKLCARAQGRAMHFYETHNYSTEQYLATPEGAVVRGSGAFEESQGVIRRREIILPKVETYERARNLALELLYDIDFSSGRPIVGKIGICKGMVTGRVWHNFKVTLRLDYDLVKGPHINVTDFRAAKGPMGVAYAIPFEGSEKTVEQLLKHMQGTT